MTKQISIPNQDDFLKQESELKRITEATLERARKKGVSQAALSVSVDQGFSINVRMNEVDTLEHHRNKAFGIVVYFGHQKGASTTNDLSDESIERALDAACNIAKYTASDPYNGLADADLMAFHYVLQPSYFPWDITPENAIQIAKLCESSGRKLDKRIINSEGASISTHQGLHIYANTHNFIGITPATSHELSCILVAKEGDSMQRSFDYTIATDARDLISAETVGKIAAEKTIARLHPQRIKTGRYPVLYSAELARGLIGSFVAAVSGYHLYRKASFLHDHLGKQIFPAFMQIDEDPNLLKGFGSVPFDDEGVKTNFRHIIQDGILQGYFLNSYSARKLGMKTTGNAGGIHNLIIKPNAGHLTELFKQMQKGFYVTELMGQGSNILTGDYSRGASGFWIENGEIQYPVAEVTIAANLKNMFQNMIAMGNEIDYRGKILAGPILIAEMTVAGE